MSANNLPVIPLTPNIGTATLTTQNQNLNGTGTLVTVFTAGANGSRLDQIKAEHLGTNVATVLRVFLQSSAVNSGTAFLYRELSIAANTLSQTAQSVDTYILQMGCFLKSGFTVQVAIGTTVAAGIQVIAEGGDF